MLQQLPRSPIQLSFHPKQGMLRDTKANEIAFGGASEGGKSHGGRVCLINWCTAIPNLQCFIFRKHYAEVIGNHMDGPTSFPVLLEPWEKEKLVTINETEVKFNFNNSLITLASVSSKKDVQKHRGREKHVNWIDEAAELPWSWIQELNAWVRMPNEMKEKLPDQLRGLYPGYTDEELRNMFPRILYTFNPEGEGIGAIRRQFVLPKEPMTIFRAPEKDGGRLRIFIPSKIADNPSADPVAQRARLLPLGEARARALIDGDMSAPIGDYFKEFEEKLHVINDFTPPAHWMKFRTFDWGSADPFAVYWFCVSDGEYFTDDIGRRRMYPRGSLIVYREWYGCMDEDPAKGLHMPNAEIAKGIVERTPREEGVLITFTDSFPFADRGGYKAGNKYTIADEFAENGCPLVLGNTRRVYGWTQLRARLVGEAGVPMIYFMHRCPYIREYLPALQYHATNPEDAVESGEATHSCDAIRLGVALKVPVTDKPVEQAERASNLNEIKNPRSLIEEIKKQNARYRRRAGRR